MSNIKRMKDKDGNYIYPVTHASAVFDGEGNTIEDKITNTIDKQLDEVMVAVNKIEPDAPNVRYIAHRGYSGLAPENTIPAYEEAGKAKYWGAETDIAETSDGEFVLMHDATVDRTTNGTGNVADMTLEQIKALTIDAGANISKYPDLKVPTLREYLICCKRYNMVPIIECKTITNVEGFFNILQELNMVKQVIVISFQNSTLQALREFSKDIRIQTLSPGNVEQGIRLCKQYNFDVDLYYPDATEDVVKQYHNNGIKVNVWTVNDDAIRLELESFGVDYITTDNLNNAQVEATNVQVDEVVSIGITNKLESDVKMLFNMMKTINNVSEFKLNQFDFKPGRYLSINKPYDGGVYKDQEYGEDTRAYSNLISTLYQKQLIINPENDSAKKSKIAIHGFDINMICKKDYTYQSFATPIDISEYPYIAIYANTDSIGNMTEELEQQLEAGVTIYVGDDLSVKSEELITALLPAGVVVEEGYDLTASTLLMATSGKTDGTKLFPEVYLLIDTPSIKGVYPNLLKARNVKLKVSWNSDKYKLSMHLYDKIGRQVRDTGWGTSGTVYDAASISSTGYYWSIVCGTNSGSAFTEETIQEFLESVVIEVV